MDFKDLIRSIFVVILCMILLVGIAVAIATNRQDSEDTDREEIDVEVIDPEMIQEAGKFQEYGKEMAKSVHELLKLDKSNTAIISNDPSMDESEIMGEIMGVKISKTYFNFRYDSYKSKLFNYENPKQKAWESVTEQIWRQKFAEEKNLLPTKKEIEKQTEETREGSESSDEGVILTKSLCEGMNITEDEYWEFHRRYYAPIALIQGKVTEYMEEKNMTMPDLSEIEAKIIDTEYFEQLS